MSQKSILKHIVRNWHLHVMRLRKFSRVPVPWSSIYALIQGSSNILVMYVRNLSVSQVL